MNRKILIFAFIIGLVGLFSCETMDEPEMETTSTFPMNGEYWVTYEFNGAPLMDYHLLTVTNTAADDGKHILINDENGTGVVLKSNVNMGSLTFSVDNTYDLNDSTVLSIDGGKLLEEKYTTTAGNETDSIYFELVYPNANDSTIVISGYKRTGWPIDDH